MNDKPPFRRVVVLRDAYAPLWFLRCAQPCQEGGECMPGGCYLGGSMTRDGAAEIAKRAGYEVAQ